MQKYFIPLGSLLAGLAVIAGAFGAHALKTRIEADQLQVYETGVRFLFMHAFAIIICGMLLHHFPENRLVKIAGKLFFWGTLFFSGSLFLLSTRDLLGISSWHWLGPITPLGGLLFVSAWVSLALGFIKKKSIK